MLGEKWKNLSEKQKAPYEAKAAADKKRYEEEKAAYTAVSTQRPQLAHHFHLTPPPGRSRRGVRVTHSPHNLHHDDSFRLRHLIRGVSAFFIILCWDSRKGPTGANERDTNGEHPRYF